MRSNPLALAACTLALAAAILAPAGALAADRTVRIKGNAYSPEFVSIEPRDRVTWRNDDNRTHTATADDRSWTTGPIGPGDSAERVFPDAGRFAYHCDIHPQMTGTVRVVAAASGTTSSSSSTTSSTTTTTAPTTTSSTTTTLPAPPTTFAFEPLPDEPTTTTTAPPPVGEDAAPRVGPGSGDDVPAAVSALAALLLLGTSAAAMTMLGRAGVR